MSSLRSSRNPKHVSESKVVFDKGLVKSTQSLEDFLDILELHNEVEIEMTSLRQGLAGVKAEQTLKAENKIPDAAHEGDSAKLMKAFIKFYSSDYEDEKTMQKALIEFLKRVVSEEDQEIQSERVHENRYRSDIIIANKSKGKNTKRGRPSCLIELKSSKSISNEDFTLEMHKFQLVCYVKQLISKHVSVWLLPIILFNGSSFFVGLANWSTLASFDIQFDEYEYFLFKKYTIKRFYYKFLNFRKNEIDIENLARFLVLIKSPCRLRPRRIVFDHQTSFSTVYKIDRVIGYGSSSVVYLGHEISANFPRKRPHPKSPSKLPCGTRAQSDVLVAELDVETEGTDSSSDSDDENERLLRLLQYLPQKYPQNELPTSASVNPSHYITPHHQLEPEVITETAEKYGVSGVSVALKFSLTYSVLENELKMEKLIEDDFKIGWRSNHVFSYDNKAEHFIFFRSDNNDGGLFVIVGNLHIPIVPSLFSIPELEKMKHDLDWHHLGGLLDNIEAIHKTGYVHNDIRLTNILNNWFKGDKFHVSDFGFMTKNNHSSEYFGTEETASQKVLLNLSRGIHAFATSFEDDLESFLKLIKIKFNRLILPEYSQCKDKLEYYRQLFAFWMFDTDIQNFISFPDIASKKIYLRDYFSTRREYTDALKVYRRLQNKKPLPMSRSI